MDDAAVWYEMHVAIRVAHDRRADADPFDGSGGSLDIDDITDPVLIFHDDKSARDEIFDDRLRAEANRHTDDTGAGKYWDQVDVGEYLGEQEKERDDDHHDLPYRSKQTDQCVLAFTGILG